MAQLNRIVDALKKIAKVSNEATGYSLSRAVEYAKEWARNIEAIDSDFSVAGKTQLESLASIIEKIQKKIAGQNLVAFSQWERIAEIPNSWKGIASTNSALRPAEGFEVEEYFPDSIMTMDKPEVSTLELITEEEIPAVHATTQEERVATMLERIANSNQTTTGEV